MYISFIRSQTWGSDPLLSCFREPLKGEYNIDLSVLYVHLTNLYSIMYIYVRVYMYRWVFVGSSPSIKKFNVRYAEHEYELSQLKSNYLWKIWHYVCWQWIPEKLYMNRNGFFHDTFHVLKVNTSDLFKHNFIRIIFPLYATSLKIKMDNYLYGLV